MNESVEKPLVSVVIPTYKRPTDLKRAIDSVLNQTYSNIEIFVVDDNNADTPERKETESLMAQYDVVPNVTYLKHDKNRNGSAARNTGWRASKGKYITFLDDDDEISQEKIEKQVDCLENLDESWGACYTAYKLAKPDGTWQTSTESRSGDVYIFALMRTMFMGSGSNLFLRKSVVDEIGGYDESFQRNQDVEFLARATEHYKLAFIDEFLLIIHQEVRAFKFTYEQVDAYAQYYLRTFQKRFERLSKKDRKRVISVISLERARVAFSAKKYKTVVKILVDNKVTPLSVIKYIIYFVHRVVTHKSYGFSL